MEERLVEHIEFFFLFGLPALAKLYQQPKREILLLRLHWEGGDYR